MGLTRKGISRGSDASWRQMAIFTAAGGSKASDTALGYAFTRTAQCIRGHGRMESGV